MPSRCLVVAAIALVIAGCGGSGRPARHEAAQTTTAATAATSTDCNALGINPTGMHEGTCTHAGVTYVIVDENHPLDLHTLIARLSSLRTATTLAGGQSATARGRFVVASILVTNRMELPQTFDASGTQQSALILDGTVYPEDVGIEKSSDPASCRAASAPVASGKGVVCQVVFDVPTASATDLGKHGRADLYLVDFGSDLAGGISPQTVGQIRLYR